MLVKGQPRKVAGRPKSKRKHVEAAKEQPRARNALIRNRETGHYEAITDGELVDAINAINLRLNALELNQRKLAEGFHQPQSPAVSAPTGNVVPMSVARKERGEAVQASQPGNEAEVLVLPRSNQPVPVEEVTPLKTGNTEPTLVGRVVSIPSGGAANDDSFNEAVATTVIRDEDQKYVAALADAYQMPLTEASEILYREWRRREDSCLRHHGVPRKDKRLERTLDNKGLCKQTNRIVHWIPSAEVASGFRAWSRSMFQRECELKGYARPAIPQSGVKLVPGEQAYRKKQLLKRIAARPKGPIPGLQKVDAVHRKLFVPPPPTSAAQLKAAGTALYAGYQKLRKLFRMEPTVRNMNQRTAAEVAVAISGGGGGTIHARRQATAPVDLIGKGEGLTQAELVRRYQRNGIGY